MDKPLTDRMSIANVLSLHGHTDRSLALGACLSIEGPRRAHSIHPQAIPENSDGGWNNYKPGYE